jgi:HlyD family secretion protein
MNGSDGIALAPGLRPATAPVANAEQARRLMRLGAWIVIGAVLPIAAWVSFAPLSMAVVAPAEVRVDLNRRPVQHLEGGIVQEVLVRNGQKVEAGEPLLRFGSVGIDADRNRLDYRVHIERASLARLEAEQTMAAEMRLPRDLRAAAAADPRVAKAIDKEQTLFQARRGSLDSEIALLQLQRERVEQEIVALAAQIERAQNSLQLQQDYLSTNLNLVKDGFISPTRVGQIEATVADYGAKIEAQRSELARGKQRLGDIDLKVTGMRNQYMQQASDQIKVTAARLTEIEQEQRKSEDAATRQVVVAPAAGEVIDLRFTSPGAVVGPGEAIAEIVPSDARLMVEARIRPEDINHVYRDQTARIKFTAFKFRNAMMVTGIVTYVSADRLLDRATQQPYYSVTILADEASLRSIEDLRLQAGMPAEVYLDGSEQTALQYLLDPITSTFRRAGRQM